MKALPWQWVRRAFVGIAPAVVMSVSSSGELAYEIHVPNAQLHSVHLGLRRVGEAHGMRLFGSCAVESMRPEKGYRHWKADLVTEFTPEESGLSRFVKMDKPGFIGRAGFGIFTPRRAFVSLALDCDRAPAHGGDSIPSPDGRLVGSVTSAGWGHRIGKKPCDGLRGPGSRWGLLVEIIGGPVPAAVVPDCPHDAEYARVRA